MAETIVTDAIPATVSIQNEYGDDVGNNWFLKAGAMAAGAIGGYFAGRTISGNKPLGNIIGSVAGVVAAYKVVPEIVTDVQRGIQHVNQQVEQGKSEGKLSDRFKAILGNICDFNGQTYMPTAGVSDSTMNVD